MDLNLLMSQRWALANEIPSQLKNNGSVASGWTNIQLFGRLLAVLGVGALDTTIDLQLQAAQDVLGTGSKTVKSLGGNASTYSNANAPLADATTAATGAAATSGGALPAGNYYAKYTWFNAAGETLPSAESAAIATNGTGGQNSITLTLPAIPAGALGANIYLTLVGGASGTERYVGQMTTGTTFVCTAQPGTTSLTTTYNTSPPPATLLLPAAPPAINTTGDIRRHSVINCRVGELGDGFNYARLNAVIGNGTTGANFHAELWASDIRYDPAENYNYGMRDIVR